MDASVAIVLFDTTKNSSFEKAAKILEQLETCDIPFKVLVANKMDLLMTKKVIDPVLQKEAEILAKNARADYFTCSSTQEDLVNLIYNNVMKNVQGIIGGDMDIQNLIGKNISVGKRVFEHPLFLKTLEDNCYFKS
jgi:GTPase SAR1 family protein